MKRRKLKITRLKKRRRRILYSLDLYAIAISILDFIVLGNDFKSLSFPWIID